MLPGCLCASTADGTMSTERYRIATARADVTSPALPPGPALPAWLQPALWFGWPVGFLERCARRHGDVFTLRLLLGPPTVMVGDPALADRVLALGADVATAGEENALLAPLLGERSVLMLDGPEHLRQRRLLAPLLHGERTRGQAGVIAAIVA